ALARVGPDLRDEALAARAARTVEVADLGGAEEAGATGFARIPWSAVGTEGELRLAGASLSVRCLQRPDGGLATGDHPDEALTAVVARAY
ncbi:MAG: proline--tRNA ligase, partial [Acidimicrobiales bacterium]